MADHAAAKGAVDMCVRDDGCIVKVSDAFEIWCCALICTFFGVLDLVLAAAESVELGCSRCAGSLVTPSICS